MDDDALPTAEEDEPVLTADEQADLAELYEVLAVCQEKMPDGFIRPCDKDTGRECVICYLADLPSPVYTRVVGVLLRQFAATGPTASELRHYARESRALSN
jgi:hypothetical protein